MISITVDVPRDGTWIELVPRAGSYSGQVVVVLPEHVEMRSSSSHPPRGTHHPAPPPVKNEKQAAEAKKSDLTYILQRLLKLKPSTRKAAINSIKTMFQFHSPMSDEEANDTLEKLRKKRLVAIDADNKVSYPKV